MSPLVSTLIPCHNTERWIGQAIESALAQTWPNLEVIVVDDGSTDASLDIIKNFGDKIRFETGPHRGGNATRNYLLNLAQGEWLQYLDADDYLLPHKIASQMAARADHPEASIIYGPVLMEYWSESQVRQELISIPEPRDVWILLASWGLPQTGGALWDRKAIFDVGGWNPTQPCCQEHELYLRLLIAGKKFAYCSEGEAIYRQWSETTVCRRNIAEVHRRRLAIELAAEKFLRQTQQLTQERLRAISQARFEISRGAWEYDRAFASSIFERLLESDPEFEATGPAAPLAYRIALRWLGFESAQAAAAGKRKLAKKWFRKSTNQKELQN